MRLALKNTLFLIAAYAAILFVLAGVAFFQLLTLEANVRKETTQLFAREVAGALTEPSLDRLLQADQEARQTLKSLIEQLTRNSQVVTSISVVDRDGRVVASDDRRSGTRLPTPQQIFGSSPGMRFVTFAGRPFSSGSYELIAPLIQRGERVGYLRIGLQSLSLGEMNRRMWDRLFFAAILGLLCITGLGFALHVQLTRRGKTLARTIEAAIRGESPRIAPELSEFSAAIETAGRVGLEITRAGGRGAEGRGRFVTLGQILNVGVMLLDDGGRLAFASRRARELFGTGSDAELARALEEMRPALEKGLKQPAAAGGDAARVDVDPPGRVDGTRLRLEVYSLGHQSDGRLVLIRDRATIHALETDLRLASQLKGLARLYLSVVHDIRAPLAAVVTHLDLLNGTFEADAAPRNGVDERRRNYLATAGQELQRLRRSLDSLLDHTALPKDDLEELDLRDQIVELDRLLRPQCERQKVALRVRVPDQPVRVLGTRDALKQALVNVGINALEAMPQGGTLSLELAVCDSRATISIGDSGPGIAPEIGEKIFTMHFTTKRGGTGIGLYVARAVVESNGGDIRVSSEPGHGATFRIELPALSQEA
ncbi:MAG: ATP-binding protein [Candidatus Eiseniibacteriota bacterium]